MTISNILEHWATIYKPLSHKPEGKLEEQAFFRILDLEEENIFTRNANLIHSPCMLHRVVSSGELKTAKQTQVTHQVCFLVKVKDTAQKLGRHDGLKQQQAADELMEMCEDFISYMIQLRKTQVCPVTGTSFKGELQLAMELSAIDTESFAYGVNPFFRGPQWLLADCYWTSIKPLFNFDCMVNAKYLTPAPPTSNK